MTDCNWPRYESHKIVQAAKIVGVARDDEDNLVIWVRPEGDDTLELERFEPTIQAMKKEAEVGGVALHYPDGFRSINRQKNFEADYKRIP